MNAYKTWLTRLNAETMTKGHIDAYGQIVCAMADAPNSYYGKRTSLTNRDH